MLMEGLGAIEGGPSLTEVVLIRRRHCIWIARRLQVTASDLAMAQICQAIFYNLLRRLKDQLVFCAYD